ncbi:MAG TPA: hypothetical protein PLE61_15315 [Vicinamibacterales bacterium]|nr:hypothetical protein [Vicinamibacterales bacterium]
MDATISIGIAGLGIVFPPVAAAVSGGGSANIDREEIASGQTDAEVEFAVPYQGASLIAFHADKACHVKTNSPANPDDEFDLTAGQVLLFVDDGTTQIGTNPFTADVSKLYVTTTDDAVVLSATALFDATP